MGLDLELDNRLSGRANMIIRICNLQIRSLYLQSKMIEREEEKKDMKCKVKKVLLMYSVIVITLAISNTKSYAKEVEQLRVVSDEEYNAFRQNEAEQENSIEPMSEENDDGMQSIYDLMKDQPEIPEEYIKEENRISNGITINSAGLRSIPESTLTPYVINNES